jgi:hypothetical protein
MSFKQNWTIKSALEVFALEKATATVGLPPIHDRLAIGEVPTEDKVTVVKVITWLSQYFGLDIS